jgi:hypothetical protein
MKRSLCAILILLTVVLSAPAQEEPGFNLSSLSFAVVPKVFKDYVQTYYTMGLRYHPLLSGALRLRYVNDSAGQESESGTEGGSDYIYSYTSQKKNTLEVYLLPLEVNLDKVSGFKFNAGAGLYYSYINQTQRSHSDVAALGQPPLNAATVNFLQDDFNMHILGPALSAGTAFVNDRVNISLTLSAAPFYVFWADTSQKIKPLMAERDSYRQFSRGSPYLLADLSAIIYKYVMISVLYDFSLDKYQLTDFDYDSVKNEFFWLHPSEKVRSHSFKFEGSLLWPMGGGYVTQLGYGYTIDKVWYDNDLYGRSSATDHKQYFIFAVRKLLR